MRREEIMVRRVIVGYTRNPDHHYGKTLHLADYSLGKPEVLGGIDRIVWGVYHAPKYRYLGGANVPTHPVAVAVNEQSVYIIDEPCLYDDAYIARDVPSYYRPRGTVDDLRVTLLNAGVYEHDGRLRAQLWAERLGVEVKGEMR
jgi:hypothetical protein